MKRNIAMLFSFILLTAMPLYAAVPKTLCEELRRLQLLHTQNLLIVDVRDPNAFSASHIQGAQNIPAKTIETAGLPRTDQIILYCGEASCPLSTGAANTLIKDGYSHISILDGGLAAWSSKGYPVQKGTTAHHSDAHRTKLKDAQASIANGNAIPVDTRPKAQFAAGHLPHAKNAPLEELANDLINLPKDKQLLVYDRDPKRCKKAVDQLIAAGFNATELNGGIAGWVKRKGRLEVK
jgi:rhodanese-related sulfurtransferase